MNQIEQVALFYSCDAKETKENVKEKEKHNIIKLTKKSSVHESNEKNTSPKIEEVVSGQVIKQYLLWCDHKAVYPGAARYRR